MAYSYVDYSGNGVITQFAVTFPYLDRSHVILTVGGSTVPFTWLDDTNVISTTAPTTGTNNVRVKRVTPIVVPRITFVDGGTITQDQLNQQSKQEVYALQEQIDFQTGGVYTNFPVLAAASVSQDKLATDAIYQVDTIAALKALVTKYATVYVRGYYITGDGGGGFFKWNSSDVTADNLGTIITPNAGGTGRWNRVYEGLPNVRHFGAKGDLSTDDTTAIQACFTWGKGVFFPIGQYKITARLTVPNNISIIGVPCFEYPNYALDIGQITPAYAGTCSIIQTDSGYAGAFFSQLQGVVMDGMCFRKSNYPAPSTADLTNGPVGACIVTRCRFENIAAFRYDNVSAFGDMKFTYNRIAYCQKAFFYGNLVDCLIHGNTFTAHNATAIDLQPGSGLNQITANRFEYGIIAVNLYQSRDTLIANNFFDRSSGAHIYLIDSECTINSNDFWRSGFNNTGVDVAHIHLEQPRKVVLNGNQFTSGFQDGGGGTETPQYILNIKDSAKRRVVMRGNNVGNGYTTGVFNAINTTTEAIDCDQLDVGIGRLTPNTASDPIAAIISKIDSCCVSGVELVIHENRKVNTFAVCVGRVVLVGDSSTVVTLDQSTGTTKLAGAHNILIGAVTLTRIDKNQMASSVPNGFDQNGRWPVGTKLWAAAPAAAAPVGWCLTTIGSPDTWRAMPNL